MGLVAFAAHLDNNHITSCASASEASDVDSPEITLLNTISALHGKIRHWRRVAVGSRDHMPMSRFPVHSRKRIKSPTKSSRPRSNMAKRKLSFDEDGDEGTQTRSPSLEPPDVVDAAEALTKLHSVTPSTTPPPPVLPSLGTPTPPGVPPQVVHPLVHQVERLSKHKLVQGAAKYYESSKRNYPHFNYAASMVERAAIPVVNKIEVNLNSRHQSRLEAERVVEFHERLSQAQYPSAGVKKRRLSEDSNASGVSTAAPAPSKEVSAETRKRLQFCLHILKLANDNITDKVHCLQEMMVKQEQEMTQEKSPSPPPQEQEAQSEIVSTVKKIIHLISNFKPSSLSSEPLSPVSSNTSNPGDNSLKSVIRDIILNLPSQIQGSDGTNDRIFVFAKESLDMIGKLTKVLNQQLEVAEEWMATDENNQGDSSGCTTPRATTTAMSDISRVDSQQTLTASSTPCKRISIDELTK